MTNRIVVMYLIATCKIQFTFQAYYHTITEDLLENLSVIRIHYCTGMHVLEQEMQWILKVLFHQIHFF